FGSIGTAQCIRVIDQQRHPSSNRWRTFMSADCGWCPAMVTLRAGRFLMGSPSDEAGRLAVEGPQHLVTIEKPFAIGKFTVTVDQFGAFVAETAYPVGATCAQWNGVK